MSGTTLKVNVINDEEREQLSIEQVDENSEEWRKRVNSQSSTSSCSSASSRCSPPLIRHNIINNSKITEKPSMKLVNQTNSRSDHYYHCIYSNRKEHYLLNQLSIDKNHPWFYECMSREDADQLLTKYSNINGVFLVRTSKRSTEIIVLSYIFNCKVNHIQIKQIEFDHQLLYSIDFGKTKFYDIQQLIEFYQLNLSYLPTRLTHFLVHKRST